MAPDKPVVDFDHHSAEFNADPVRCLTRLLAESPVAWTEAHGGYWIVTGGEEAARVQRQAGIFSSARTEHGGVGTETILPKSPSEIVNIPIETDPPAHTRYRQLLNPALSPTATEAMRPQVQHWVNHFIDEFIEDGACDLVYDFASPIPAVVTMEWLGWPTEEWSRLAHLAHDLMGYPPGSERWTRAVGNSPWINQRLAELIAERRREPRDDFISRLLEQQVDGQPMTDELAVCMLHVLVFGGVDTTTALTSQALLHLHQRLDQRQALIDRPELIVTATEEFLRVYPPVVSSARTVRQDTELGGCPMHVGDRVLAMRWSANLDPEQFPDPETFDLERSPNRHQTFGLGPHRCAGSHLARIMFQEMITRLLKRIPDYEIDESQVSHYPDQGAFSGLTLLPAKFTAGQRVGNDS